MLFTQRPMRSVLHHQEWHIITADAEIQQLDDMRMSQTEGTSLVDKFLQLIAACQPCLKEFDGGLTLRSHMLAQINITKSTTSEPPQQAILPNLLAYAIRMVRHWYAPSVPILALLYL